MSRGGAFALALTLALAGSASAQDEDPAKTGKASSDDTKGGEGRVPFKREQGTCAALEAQFKQILAALGQRYPDLPYPSPTQTAGPDSGGLKRPGGEKPAATTPPDAEQRAEQERKDPLLASLRAWRPTKEALVDVLTPEGLRALGKVVYTRGRVRFAPSDPRQIAQSLGLHPSMSEVQVFSASSEELATMESGTVSAKEFASGLRGLAQYLKPRYQFYVVVLDRPAAEKARNPKPKDALDSADARLQLFVHSGQGFVYLGRLWRLPESQDKQEEPEPEASPKPGK